jgi:regulation of enolase protein 1 (concanavalin A-like superfamily)
VLIEDFQASSTFAKVGIMFRSSLSQNSSHYSIFESNENGNQPVQQHRPCMGCNTSDYNTTEVSIQQSYSSVWLRVTKVGNVFKAFYKPNYLAKAAPWYPFGHQLSLNTISSNGYFVGIATASGSNSVATSYVSNIQLTRTCSNKFITQLQCDQASNVSELGNILAVYFCRYSSKVSCQMFFYSVNPGQSAVPATTVMIFHHGRALRQSQISWIVALQWLFLGVESLPTEILPWT